MVPRFAPQNHALASNNLARILVEPCQNGNLVQKGSTLDATSVAQVRSRWRGENRRWRVQGTHGVLRIFVMAHLVFRLRSVVGKSITNARNWPENPNITIRIFLVKFLRRVLDSVRHKAIANSPDSRKL